MLIEALGKDAVYHLIYLTYIPVSYTHLCKPGNALFVQEAVDPHEKKTTCLTLECHLITITQRLIIQSEKEVKLKDKKILIAAQKTTLGYYWLPAFVSIRCCCVLMQI